MRIHIFICENTEIQSIVNIVNIAFFAVFNYGNELIGQLLYGHGSGEVGTDKRNQRIPIGNFRIGCAQIRANQLINHIGKRAFQTLFKPCQYNIRRIYKFRSVCRIERSGIGFGCLHQSRKHRVPILFGGNLNIFVHDKVGLVTELQSCVSVYGFQRIQNLIQIRNSVLAARSFQSFIDFCTVKLGVRIQQFFCLTEISLCISIQIIEYLFRIVHGKVKVGAKSVCQQLFDVCNVAFLIIAVYLLIYQNAVAISHVKAFSLFAVGSGNLNQHLVRTVAVLYGSLELCIHSVLFVFKSDCTASEIQNVLE